MPREVKKIHNERRLKIIRRSLRNESTSAEATLWQGLKKRQLQGRKFRRQHSIGSFVVDFYCPAEKLAVELDGEVHNDPLREEYDAERDMYLREHNILVVRFENSEVFENIETVLASIAEYFQE